jgi:hypothetical protein
MAIQQFDQAQALVAYTELVEKLRVLSRRAAQQGLQFLCDDHGRNWTLENMTAEELAEYKTELAAQEQRAQSH